MLLLCFRAGEYRSLDSKEAEEKKEMAAERERSRERIRNRE